ncbi:MAG: hypothetical protein M3342_15620, partial [Bacteroidota bacterium]|nr:hypothetical protein [Bacteroidota bacterium]
GMAVELYGKGMVMGIDPGKGITYEAPMHVNYYAQWAAHNTVVSGAASTSVPAFKGGGGTKNMGAIQLEAMEPRADKEAVSPYCSFTDTRYTDISTKTPQQRTLAIIRTSETSGYYVDIYRSANAKSNEYVYHNIGNKLEFLDINRKPIAIKPTDFPISKEPYDPPGFRLIKDYQTTGKTDKNIVALFSLKENGADKYMQVLFTGEEDRTFYSGKGPQSGTADVPYRTMPTPTLICRQEGEAWKHPFIAVYEPFTSTNNYTVERIENADRAQPDDFTAVNVFNKNGGQQIILQSLNSSQLHKKETWKFKGSFGVINLEKNQLNYLYLGKGQQIAYQQYAIETKAPDGSANIIFDGSKLIVSCDRETTVTIPTSSAKAVTIMEKGQTKQVPVIRTKEGISFTVPAVSNAAIQIN